jgi:hypothetical protein
VVHSGQLRLRSMQKFALKLLLTRLVVRRQSKRIEGVQVVTTFITLAVIAFVGIYVWAHGVN